MSSYQYFAEIYDELTENVDYEVRSDYISGFLCQQGINDGTILDLACGTGSIGNNFLKKGFRIIGLDYSEKMLEIASNKFLEHSNNFSLMKAKMQDFELADKVDACVCSLDSINHLNDIKDVQEAFNCVYNSLRDNGVFVFDINTVYKHNNVLADNTFIFDEEDYYVVWDNEKADDRIVRILIDIFMWNGDSYDRYSEEFNETAYTIEEITDCLEKAGFCDVSFYDELTLNDPKDDSERLYVVCKKGI